MTRDRIRPTTREPKMPIATSTADRPVRPAFRPEPSALVKFVVWCRLAERPARLLHEVGLDEHVDVAVEDAVDVAHLLFGPMVLHHLVRMEHVAANLVAERDFLLGAADLIQLRLV